MRESGSVHLSYQSFFSFIILFYIDKLVSSITCPDHFVCFRVHKHTQLQAYIWLIYSNAGLKYQLASVGEVCQFSCGKYQFIFVKG
jgi:hypothetical protein